MAIITVGATGADYTSLATAVANSLDNDTIQIIDSNVYDEAWPNNINWGNLTFIGLISDIDNFPTIRFTGNNYDNWWNNQNGTRNFFNLKIGDFDLNGSTPTTSSGKVLIGENLLFDGNTTDCFLVGDNPTANRIRLNNIIFRNCSRVFKESSTKNNNQQIGYATNCVFDGCTEIGDLSPNANNQRQMVVSNSILINSTSIGCNSNCTDNWDYNLAGLSEPFWGVGNVQRVGNPFSQSTRVNPSDYSLKSGSQAIDIGETSGYSTTTTDFEGTLWTEPRDIGVFEFASGSTIREGSGISELPAIDILGDGDHNSAKIGSGIVDLPSIDNQGSGLVFTIHNGSGIISLPSINSYGGGVEIGLKQGGGDLSLPSISIDSIGTINFKPVISYISELEGRWYDQITMVVENLPESFAVTLDGVEVEIISVNDKEVVWRVPQIAIGNRSLKVVGV